MSATKFRSISVKDLATTGNTVIGDASTDTLTVTAQVASSVVPSTNNARDLGSSSKKWKDLYLAGTATIATVDINAGTIDGVTIGADLEGPITGSTVTATDHFVGDLTGDVTGSCSGNAATATAAASIASSGRFSATSTGTGSEQSIAHGLGAVPGLVWVIPISAGGSPLPIVEGIHNSTNLKVTVPSGVGYKVCAIK